MIKIYQYPNTHSRNNSDRVIQILAEAGEANIISLDELICLWNDEASESGKPWLRAIEEPESHTVWILSGDRPPTEYTTITPLPDPKMIKEAGEELTVMEFSTEAEKKAFLEGYEFGCDDPDFTILDDYSVTLRSWWDRCELEVKAAVSDLSPANYHPDEWDCLRADCDDYWNRLTGLEKLEQYTRFYNHT